MATAIRSIANKKKEGESPKRQLVKGSHFSDGILNQIDLLPVSFWISEFARIVLFGR